MMNFLYIKTYSCVILFMFLVVLTHYGQQNAQFSQYLQNPLVLNPGIVGAEDFLDVTTSYRNQWAGFEGAPRTGTLSFHTPISMLSNGRSNTESHSGVGALLYSDTTGPITQSGYYLGYAYHLKASEDWFVSLGTYAGVSQFGFDTNEVVLLEDPTDILVQNISESNFDMSLGLYVYSKYLFVGLAGHQIFDRTLSYGIENGVVTSGKRNRNYNFLLGSRMPLDRDWTLVPSGVLRTVENAPVQWDVSLKAEYQNRLWGGVSYRNRASVYALVGFRVWDYFSVGYSYDYPISEFSNNQSGSHEIVLSYRFFKGKTKCGCAVNTL